MYVTIIILIVVLLIAAIFINAIQQHRAKIDAERRAEIAKQKTIIDETENVIMACANMPISSRVLQILDERVLNALKILNEHASSADIKQRISDAQQKSLSNANESVSQNDFVLPDNDKLIIQYIQAVKKLRVLLRSEHSKGRVASKIFVEEEKQLERLQIKVNVETLIKRGRSAHQSNMLGSARQYYEKAKSALEGQNQQDDYSTSRLATLQEWLSEIQNNLKNVNAQDRAKKQEEERDELDELFAPKKKW
eukprot:TRINITY_DN278_c0_g1_i4.p1 TRINITY_DN278_c0_g1~~TRINITY_DN278_c0_g1_i4.p1  ORF type:complete len:252 (+),score=51.49 TRINITY_DN278_c0_g1_i4:342-1097(+)